MALSEDTKPLPMASSLLKASIWKLKIESRIKERREALVITGHTDTADGSPSTFLPQILMDTLHHSSWDSGNHRIDTVSILLTDTLECIGWKAGGYINTMNFKK